MHLAAVTLADPIALHRFDLFGPTRQMVQFAEQLLSIGGDPHEIHGDVALFHQGAGTPAAPVDDLLIRQYGIVHRVPIDRGGLLIDQSFFK